MNLLQRHGERSEAIHRAGMDGHDSLSLAKTKQGGAT